MTETEILEALDELRAIAGTEEVFLDIDFLHNGPKGVTVSWGLSNNIWGEASSGTISGAIEAARAEMLRPEPPAV